MLFTCCCLLLVATAIPISFEQRQYSFQEADALIDSVFVTKGDVISEQNLTLLVQLSGNDLAIDGKLLRH